MNIFIHELKSYRKSTLIWMISLSTIVVVFLMMFTAFTKDVETSRSILSHLPPAIRSAFDISMQNFFTIYGFFAYLFTFVGLAGAVQAMNLGISVISKEDSGKTVDFLLTKPISRTRIITSKLLAVLSLLSATNVVFSAIALATAKFVSTAAFSSKTFLMISGILLLIQLFFMALGVLMSVMIPKIKSTITVALPTVFTFFVIGTLGAIIGNDNVRYISPFKFYDANYVISHNSYELKFLVIEAIFIIIAVVASYAIYIKKDIKAAA